MTDWSEWAQIVKNYASHVNVHLRVASVEVNLHKQVDKMTCVWITFILFPNQPCHHTMGSGKMWPTQQELRLCVSWGTWVSTHKGLTMATAEGHSFMAFRHSSRDSPSNVIWPHSQRLCAFPWWQVDYMGLLSSWRRQFCSYWNGYFLWIWSFFPCI